MIHVATAVQFLTTEIDLRANLITLHRGINKLTEEKLRMDMLALEEQMAERDRPRTIQHSVIV